MRRFIFILPCLLLVAAMAGCAPGQEPPSPPAQSAGGLMEQLTLDELAIRADSILVGEVTDITAYQEENGNIYTLATISVEQTVKGQTRDKATLRTLGGELDGQVMWVEGTPGFQPGERVVVFLKKGGGAFTIIGGFQGKFIIDGNDMVSGNIPLTEFTQQIRDILIEQ